MYWRLHPKIFDKTHEDQLNTAINWIALQGDICQVVYGSAFDCQDVLSVEPQPALAMTTLQDARKQSGALKGACTPWLFYDDSNYSVSSWLPRIDKEIPTLNRGGIFLPFSSIKNLSSELLSALSGVNGCVFIKPDKGHKSFTGNTFNTSQWNEELEDYFRGQQPNDEVMCFLAPARSLRPIEWRFWIVNRQMVAFSPYSWDDSYAQQWHPAPAEALWLAEQVANNAWQPDLAYVVDIVTDTDGSSWVNEINAASTSGIYQAPVVQLLQAFRDVAHLEFDGELTL